MDLQRQVLIVLIAILVGMLTGCAHDEGYCGGSFKSEAELRRAYPGIPDPDPNSSAARY